MRQVVLLNEDTESRTIKLGLHLSECCTDMEIMSLTSTEQNKHKQDSFILLGKSGHLYLYDDSLIEKYLLQCQSKSTPSLPREVIVKLPLTEASITTAKFICNNSNVFNSEDEVIRFWNYKFCFTMFIQFAIFALPCSLFLQSTFL